MEKTDRREVMEIDLRRILYVLWIRIWAIILVAVLLAAMCFGYATFFIAPTYSARAQLYVNNNYVGSPGFSSSQITAALALADTYMVIMESHNVLDEVIARTDLGYSYAQLRKMLTAATVNETEVFEICVTCTDYKHAAIIANTIVDVLPDKIAAVVEGSSVRVIDRAVENPNPVGPNYRNYLLIGFVLGAVLAAAVVVILDIMDTSISSEEYLTQAYEEVPLLAVIPSGDSDKNSYYKGYYETKPKSRSGSRSGGAAK